MEKFLLLLSSKDVITLSTLKNNEYQSVPFSVCSVQV